QLAVDADTARDQLSGPRTTEGRVSGSRTPRRGLGALPSVLVRRRHERRHRCHATTVTPFEVSGQPSDPEYAATSSAEIWKLNSFSAFLWVILSTSSCGTPSKTSLAAACAFGNGVSACG